MNPVIMDGHKRKGGNYMKTVTLDILNDHAFTLLKDLEKLKVIRLRKDNSQKEALTEGKKKVSFRALSIDTKNL